MTQTNTRHLLRLTGQDARSFLQGMVTNSVDRVAPGQLVYAALLTPQGKYLADFFMLADPEDPENPDTILLDCDAAQSDMLAKRLTMFRLRADVTIAPDPRQVTRGTGTPPAGALADPRHSALGWRAYGAEATEDDTDWLDLHVRHCIPSAGLELTPDSFILEMGFERLNGVDFKKGCYVGQEVTARMKHKTVLRKGLALVSVEGAAAFGTEITTAEGKPVGRLLSRSQDQAMAYLRFDRAEGELNAEDARVTAQL